MLRKILSCRTQLLVCFFAALTSCENKRNFTPDNPFSIDTTRARQSVISIQQAIALQRSFITTRTRLGKLLPDTNFLPLNFNLPNGESFTKDALLLLLSQKGADGIRFFYGKDSAGVVRLVLLPVTKDGRAIYNKLITSPRIKAADTPMARTMGMDTTGNEAVETGQTCPPCLIDPQQQ